MKHISSNLRALANSWNGNCGCGWSFDRGDYLQYISKYEIYSIIRSLDNTKLNTFSEVEQIKLASFILEYEGSEFNDANEIEAKRKVESWK